MVRFLVAPTFPNVTNLYVAFALLEAMRTRNPHPSVLIKSAVTQSTVIPDGRVCALIRKYPNAANVPDEDKAARVPLAIISLYPSHSPFSYFCTCHPSMISVLILLPPP